MVDGTNNNMQMQVCQVNEGGQTETLTTVVTLDVNGYLVKYVTTVTMGGTTVSTLTVNIENPSGTPPDGTQFNLPASCPPM